MADSKPSKTKPITPPTDEEINKAANIYAEGYSKPANAQRTGFINGMGYVRDLWVEAEAALAEKEAEQKRAKQNSYNDWWQLNFPKEWAEIQKHKEQEKAAEKIKHGTLFTVTECPPRPRLATTRIKYREIDTHQVIISEIENAASEDELREMFGNAVVRKYKEGVCYFKVGKLLCLYGVVPNELFVGRIIKKLDLLLLAGEMRSAAARLKQIRLECEEEKTIEI
jgi:hypothetical protein